MAKITGIYCIVNLINNKYYVGSAASIVARKRNHGRDLANGVHANKHLQSAYNKYGPDAFEFRILASDIPTKEERYECEQFWIDHLDACKAGYNKAKFAYGGCGSHSEATKQKQREARLGMRYTLSEDACKNIGLAKVGSKNPMFGISRYSDEAERLKRCSVRGGIYPGIRFTKNRYQASPNGKYLGRFENLDDAIVAVKQYWIDK